jgi:hypothetical protein
VFAGRRRYRRRCLEAWGAEGAIAGVRAGAGVAASGGVVATVALLERAIAG